MASRLDHVLLRVLREERRALRREVDSLDPRDLSFDEGWGSSGMDPSPLERALAIGRRLQENRLAVDDVMARWMRGAVDEEEAARELAASLPS